MTRAVCLLARGPFTARHRAMTGPLPDVSGLTPDLVPPALLPLAQRIWQERAASEFRSIQIMTRFLTEIVSAGDPLDVYASAVDLVADEIHHAELCAAICGALGVPAPIPDPLPLPDKDDFLSLPMAERALSTAIGMLGVNETLSVGFIQDLAGRCEFAPIRAVLDATLADEEGHGDFGWNYIRASLARFDIADPLTLRPLVDRALAPHEAMAERALRSVPRETRRLDAFPEPELARFGLLSLERQALVYRRTRETILEPRLASVGLGRGAPGEPGPAQAPIVFANPCSTRPRDPNAGNGSI